MYAAGRVRKLDNTALIDMLLAHGADPLIQTKQVFESHETAVFIFIYLYSLVHHQGQVGVGNGSGQRTNGYF